MAQHAQECGRLLGGGFIGVIESSNSATTLEYSLPVATDASWWTAHSLCVGACSLDDLVAAS